MGLVFVLVAGVTLVPGAALVLLGARLVRGPSGDAGRAGRTRAAPLGGVALLALGAGLVALGLVALTQLVARLP